MFNMSNIDGRNSSYIVGNLSNLIEGFGSRKRAKDINNNSALKERILENIDRL